MRVVIISDLHANLEALAVLPREYDQLWVLGDLVNYGPNPAEVVEFVRSRAKHVVRGNHDEFLGEGADPQCTGRFQELATVTGEFTRTRLTARDTAFLRELPLQMQLKVDHTRFWLCHATPSNPLYGYVTQESEQWKEECLRTSADFLLVGHTHAQFMKKVGNCLIVNPGSLGQPNNRSGLACYAMWDKGTLSLCSTAYDMPTTVAKVQEMPIPSRAREDLVTLLQTGRLAEESTPHAQHVALQA